MSVISLIRSNCLGMPTVAGGTSRTSSRVFSFFSLVISLIVLHLTLITELILPPRNRHHDPDHTLRVCLGDQAASDGGGNSKVAHSWGEPPKKVKQSKYVTKVASNQPTVLESYASAIFLVFNNQIFQEKRRNDEKQDDGRCRRGVI